MIATTGCEKMSLYELQKRIQERHRELGIKAEQAGKGIFQSACFDRREELEIIDKDLESFKKEVESRLSKLEKERHLNWPITQQNLIDELRLVLGKKEV